MSYADTIARGPDGLLTLLSLRGVGPQTAERWAAHFRTLGEILDADATALGTVPAAARDVLRDRNAWSDAYARACEMLQAAERHGVRVLTVAAQDYPPALKSIPHRPLVLHVKGDLGAQRGSVACIGTRRPSHFGEEVTSRLTRVLAEAGWSIVSGLAIGVDALAHRAALNVRGGHTVAVLANGLDTVYPRSNTALAEAILSAGGALVSEQPIGTPALARHLVQRDRIQSGLSVATFVMQTGLTGGSMHTVRFTLQQGRLLFAPVPTGRHASAAASQGLLALTQKTGRELRTLLSADDEYGIFLETRFGDRPPAVPIQGRSDYTKVLELIEHAAGVQTGGAAAATA